MTNYLKESKRHFIMWDTYKIEMTELFEDLLFSSTETDTLIETDDKVDELLDSLVDESHTLILHNDDHNTFDWVIKALVDICEHHPHQAEQCSLIVHYKGKCSVKEGSMDQLKPLKDGLTDRGLSATID